MKYLVTIMFLGLAMLMQANEVTYFEGTFNELKAKAKKQDKIIILKFWASWCGPCKLMDQTVLVDEEVVEIINESFLIMSVNVDHVDMQDLVEDYNVKALPTFLIITPKKGRVVAREVGMRSKAYFKDLLEQFI